MICPQDQQPCTGDHSQRCWNVCARMPLIPDSALRPANNVVALVVVRGTDVPPDWASKTFQTIEEEMRLKFGSSVEVTRK